MDAWAARREDELEVEQVARATWSMPDAARVESCSGPGSAWFAAGAGIGADIVDPHAGAIVEGPKIPGPLRADGFILPDEEAAALMRLRLGLFPTGGRCGRKTSDPKAKKERCDCVAASAEHKLTCPCGPSAIIRHNRFARLLQLLILEIPGASVRWTPRTGFWPRGKEAGEPDLRVDVPGWRPLYIDVAIVFPFSSDPGRAARLKEGEKTGAYPVWASNARVAVADFSPCVFEAFGRCGVESARIIRKLAGRSASDRGVAPGGEAWRWFSLLSLRLQLDQADILLNS